MLTRLQADRATHVVMPKLGRTVTFLCGVPFAAHVVGYRWIRDSGKEGKFLGK